MPVFDLIDLCKEGKKRRGKHEVGWRGAKSEGGEKDKEEKQQQEEAESIPIMRVASVCIMQLSE